MTFDCPPARGPVGRLGQGHRGSPALPRASQHRSGGGENPLRVHVRTPSLCNWVSVLEKAVGRQLADVPMLIAGVVGFNPVPAIVLVLGVASAGWSLYLLYIGIPAVMKVPEDRGFLFASAVVAVCLVILIAMMGAGVILWDMFQPEFSN